MTQHGPSCEVDELVSGGRPSGVKSVEMSASMLKFDTATPRRGRRTPLRPATVKTLMISPATNSMFTIMLNPITRMMSG